MNKKTLHPFIITVIIILSALFITSAGWATTYYVDATNGNNLNTGTSETTAWKTLAKLNASSFNPGDQIFLKRGELWREQLTVSSSGAINSPITLGAYGEGSLPQISGADNIVGASADWFDLGGNVWRRTLSSQPKIVIFDSGAIGINDANPSAKYKWYWSDLFLYVYAERNPSSYFSSIVASQREFCIRIENKSFLIFENIRVSHANAASIAIISSSNIDTS